MAKQLKVNDIVKVIAGDHKGESARILKIDREVGRVYLEGVGSRERHLKKSYLNPTGGKKTVYQGIAISNVKLEKAAKYEKPKTTKDTKKDAKAKKKGAK